jgi:arsenate reductase (thioredoxin)
MEFHKALATTISELTKEFKFIPASRVGILLELSQYIKSKNHQGSKIELIFICTHNSRRSHISQIWAQTAAAYYNIDGVISYSGGTEATAFNPRAVIAMEKAGFRITKPETNENPRYEVSFGNAAIPVIAFSKRFDAPSNPKSNFAAVMTCSHADENCPLVAGMEKRISLPYDDPKNFDGTPLESQKYVERVMEIGREILFAFCHASTNE